MISYRAYPISILLCFFPAILVILALTSCKKEQEKIMNVRNDSISDISNTSAEAIATIIDIGAGIDQHGHCWSTNAEPTVVNNENKTENGPVNKTGRFISTLTGLLPNTKYYVRAYVSNSSTIVYSDKILTFNTLTIGKPIVNTGIVKAVTTSSATVTANLASLGDGASSVTQHGHCWSSETITPVIGSDSKSSLGSTDKTGNYESQLIGLSESTVYFVRAYATNNAGTKYGDTISFATPELINAEFTANPTSGYLPLSVQFTDMSTGDINSWSWDLGDGQTSTAKNPLHTYDNQGSYTVTLTISDGSRTDSETKNNYIIVSMSGTAPVANFTADNTSIIEGETVNFTDQSLNVPTNWSWTFGDGGTSTSRNPSHQYNTQGVYTVILTVSNSYGSNTETKSDYITVSTSGAAPAANFSADKTSITVGEIVYFTDQSTNGPTSWSWIFGDGGTSSSQNPAHQYNTEGVYSVTLTAENSYGSDDETKNNYITVEGEPQETVTDYDGNVYNTIQIGGQLWMAENLATTHYSNGAALVDGSGAGVYTRYNTTKYYFAPENNESNVPTYGRLYTWAAIMNGAKSSNSNPSGVQGVCPSGWHVPSDSEWKELEMYLGMTQTEADDTDWRGSNQGGKLKETGTAHWVSPNNATNESLFAALPAGGRDTTGFCCLGYWTDFWTTTEYDQNPTVGAWYRLLNNENSTIYRSAGVKSYATSVRCIKND
ncbi:MAG: PKD domain-containing protein [Bacteroidales bacterium]|nr:MAG: PKD domain-containing protein [Bacteroidales bacterium]